MHQFAPDPDKAIHASSGLLASAEGHPKDLHLQTKPNGVWASQMRNSSRPQMVQLRQGCWR